MTLELSNWLWKGVMMQGGVLSIDRAYFSISGGRERWLYKVARKHAGGAGEAGFAIAMPTLYEKSGAEGPYRRFKFEIQKIAPRDNLPGYDLAIEEKADRKEPLLRMRRADDKNDGGGEKGSGADIVNKEREPHALTVSPGLAAKDVRGFIAEDTIALLRRECPGWDLYTLHAEFEAWVQQDPDRTPANWQKAFIGYVRKFDRKHRHELNRI